MASSLSALTLLEGDRSGVRLLFEPFWKNVAEYLFSHSRSKSLVS